MFLTLSLPAASLLILSILIGLTLYSLYFIKNLIPRVILLSISIVVLPLTFLVVNMILGNPRPIENHLQLKDEKYLLIGAYYIENKNIYVWLIPEEGEESDPIYFVLPWSIEAAKDVLKALDAKDKGALVEVILKPTNLLEMGGEYNPGERIDYNVTLPSPPPVKRVLE